MEGPGLPRSPDRFESESHICSRNRDVRRSRHFVIREAARFEALTLEVPQAPCLPRASGTEGLAWRSQSFSKSALFTQQGRR